MVNIMITITMVTITMVTITMVTITMGMRRRPSASSAARWSRQPFLVTRLTQTTDACQEEGGERGRKMKGMGRRELSTHP